MNLAVVAATAILAAGVVDDLRSRKFHNWLFLTCVGFAFAISLVTSGLNGLPLAALGFVAGCGIFLPLVLLKMIGAGDMKLMAAFGILAGWNAVLSVAVFSLIWGAIFGLLQVTLKGQLRGVLSNLGKIASLQGSSGTELHKIPFTVAIFVGWLTHLVLEGVL